MTARGTNNNNRKNKNLTLRDNAPFRSCMSKISDKLIYNAEELQNCYANV